MVKAFHNRFAIETSPAPSGISRRTLAKSVIVASTAIASGCTLPKANGQVPGNNWARHQTPQAAGFDRSGLMEAESAIYELPTTSLMVIKGGKIVYTYGDIAQPSYLASARKSILSMLYGKYVQAGVIDLNRTVGDIGIQENMPLLDIEKTATVRNLLTSSSAVYWPAGSPGGDENTPPRGSVKPGVKFHYNNWDFNVAGEVFQRLTGKSVFDAFQDDLAIPLGMEDWDRSRQRMLGYATEPSRYKAYHFFLSARDMARLGVLMVNRGQWNGRQVIPAEWVAESTRTVFPDADPAEKIGYGYLWWTPSVGRTGSAWKNSFLANGHFGQFILGLPAIETVIVHRRAVPDELAIARNYGTTKANIPAVKVGTFLKVADIIVKANKASSA
jgi:CubicO group peptidase (beta-lactamase class C family)